MTTSQISLQASFSPDSKEYKELEYRVLTGQNFQQAAIDKIKGIISRDMPKTWYVKAANRINQDDSDEIIAKKEFYNRICSNRKPYFFMYNYTNLKTEYDKYVKNTDESVRIRFGKSLNELLNSNVLAEQEADFVEMFYKYAPLDMSPGTINRICWAIENEFNGTNFNNFSAFDPCILKSNIDYNQSDYNRIEAIYHDYLDAMKCVASSSEESDVALIVEFFKTECLRTGLDESVLCEILIDLCYTSNKNKQLLWDAFGYLIVKNLMNKFSNTIAFPIMECGNDGFSFKGETFSMKSICVNEEGQYE